MVNQPARDPKRWLDAQLGDRVLVCDGAMGTMLHAAGASLDRCLPELNVTQPDLVSSIHLAYVDAGADIIETNTFGANRVTMQRFGLTADVELVNRKGVELARTAAGTSERTVLVAGCVAPAAAPVAHGRTPDAAALEALLEQIAALERAGVDLLMLETFGDLAALSALIRACATDIPTIAHMTFLEDGRTIGGDTPEHVAEVLADLGIVAMGANCALGPRGMRPIVEALAKVGSIPLSVQPNAGPPSIVQGRFEYRRNEEYFARVANVFVDLGASIVGGCCGTTPKHIEAIVHQLEATRPAQKEESAVRTFRHHDRVTVRPETSALPFGERLRNGEFIIAAEITPPDGADPEAALRDATLLTSAGADALIVAASPLARSAMSPISFGLLLKERLGIDVVLTASTWEKSILGLQADLLGAHAFGLRSVICTTGVPPPQGDYPDLGRVFEVSSINLISTLLSLNQPPEDQSTRQRRSTSFVIGAKVNPAAADGEWEISRAIEKLDAGVDFFVTAPLFSLEALAAFHAALVERGRSVPILLGVTPLRDFEHAEYLHFEVPGVTIPDDVLDRLKHAGSRGEEVGREIAAELVWNAAGIVQGVVVLPDEARSNDAAELLRGFLGLGEQRSPNSELDARNLEGGTTPHD
jgi:homocysteine S-methyltransferase